MVTRHVKGTNLKDICHNSLSLKEKLKILSQTTRRLKDIHAYFSHGDAQVRNVLVADSGEAIWLDYEYLINPGMPFTRQKARDLMILISSSTKHLRKPEEVVGTILDSYPDREVKKAVFSSSLYRGIVYNLFLDLMNPLLCLKMRRALREYSYRSP
jgi:tRNA A-37 threonylcarbamoyl transferase component Bud32